MSTLERAIAIATEAHRGQVDRAGESYIGHAMRVMYALPSGDPQIVGVLHDVIEDTAWTLDRLRQEGFSETVIAAVDAVSRRPNEVYMDYVRRAGENPIGRMVKIADLRDNLSPSRPADADLKSLRVRYERALAELSR